MPATPLTPVSLLRRLRSPDDHLAWKEFVAIYAPLLREFGKRLSLPDSDTEDLAQELFIVLLRRMQSFEYEHGKKFYGFLWICFLHLAKRWYRERRGVCPAAVELATLDHPVVEIKEFQQYVMARAMQVMQRRFEEPVWKAFVETRLNGRPAREVERLLGIPQKNIWVYSGRVLQALREELAGLLD